MDQESLLDTVFGKQKQQPSKEPHLPYAALAVRLICRDCRNDPPNLIEEYQDGDIICGDCGMVLGDRIIDIRNEWRTFGNDDDGMDPSRVGAAIDDVMEGVEDLSTRIGSLDDRTGSSRELQRIAFRAEGGKSDRSLIKAFVSIGQICDKMSLPKTVTDIAKQTYKRVYQEKILPQKDLQAIFVTCVFVACRQGRVARTFHEISRQTDVPKKSLAQCYKVMEKAFKSTMGSGGASSGSEFPDKAASGPETLLVRYCNHLGLPAYVEFAAVTVIKEARKYSIGEGRSPISIAAAAIYLTSHLYGAEKSIESICEVAGVAKATVKTVYKIYYDNREILVKEEWLKSGRAKLELLPVLK